MSKTEEWLRGSFKEYFLNDKPGKRNRITFNDTRSKKDTKTGRQRNWEMWRERLDVEPKKPSGPAVDINTAYAKMKNRRKNGRK